MSNLKITELTADIVSGFVGANKVSAEALPTLIASIYAALRGVAAGEPAAEEIPGSVRPTPAQIRKSITPDALISFVDGKPYKTIKRHLTINGFTLETYRERFGLPKDYPTVAPNYSAARSALAKSMGLGASGRRARAALDPAKPASRPRAKAATA